MNKKSIDINQITNLSINKKSKNYGRKKIVFTILMIFLICSIVFTGGTFLLLNFVEENSMKITVNKSQINALSIYSDSDFSNPSTVLTMRGPKKMDNITYEWLPENINDYEGGTHNGENYIAFTFHIRNTGTFDIYYSSEIIISKVTNNLDSAMRVMVIKNGERTVYAKSKSDGSAELVSKYSDNVTIPFLTQNQVMQTETTRLQTGDNIKYTLVIWIEGEDNDCTDDILGGNLCMEMKFQIEEN